MARRRSNGLGHTYEDRGRFRTVIRMGDQVISASAKTAAESRRLAQAKRDSAAAAAALPAQRPTPAQTIDAFLDEWLAMHRVHLAPSTVRRYRGIIEHHLKPGLGSVPLTTLRPIHIEAMLAQLAEAGLSSRSRQQTRAVLSVALDKAVALGLLEFNPVQRTTRITVRSQPIQPLSAQEVRLLLTAHAQSTHLARLHVAVLLGLRQGEALGLRWQDVDFDRGCVYVRQQIQKVDGKRVAVPLKTSASNRIVMLPSTTSDVLREHARQVAARRELASAWTDMDLVFPNRCGEPVQSKWDYALWHACLEHAGLPKRRLHDARHTAATLLYDAGVDIETIRRWLGHSSIQLTSRTYVHGAEQPLRMAAERLNQFH